jgi:transcriptional regulator NrdR family protein
MNCPMCDGKTTVIHCRKDQEGVYRKRKCTECDYIFFTSECEDSADGYHRAEKEYMEKRKRR